jgi:pimeloyl-ACP methyl ester carboxylesterase
MSTLVDLIAYDCRQHGSTTSPDDTDLSADTLVQDAVDLCNALYEKSWHRNANVVLVGHSMGGAIAARAAACGKIQGLRGLAVLDVVEGTAMESLPYMIKILQARPKSFDSESEAVRWALTSNTLKNPESARLSIPRQLTSSPDGKFVWRTDLESSEQYWDGWFRGLSDTFLASPPLSSDGSRGNHIARMLVLAGTDRLDTELTIGQMQGKYQLVLLPACGHVVMEDDPLTTARTLLQYQERNSL